MAKAKWNNVDIPRVARVDEGRVGTIEDTARSVSGKLLTSRVPAVKRTWEIQTTPLTEAEYGALLAHLDGEVWGGGEFWYEPFGVEANTVTAKALPGTLRAPLSSAGFQGGWQKWARTILFTVEEV